MTPEACPPLQPRSRPLKVAVLVTLERGPAAGGHVKSWERVAEIDCPLCMPFLTNMSVYVCRRPRFPLAQMWPDMKMYL